MSYILQIETATSSCSVAIANNGETLDVKQVNERNVHAEVITQFIDELIKNTHISYNKLDAIAVSSGPGSYTGLRIGISTAKGLCFALDKPLIAVETLEAMANGFNIAVDTEIKTNALLCPMIDARRMEVYTAVFTQSGVRLRDTAAEIIDDKSFADLLAKQQVVFFGDGADKCSEILGWNTNAIFVSQFVNSAAFLSGKAAKKLANKDFEDVAYFEPFYLKDFIAGSRKS